MYIPQKMMENKSKNQFFISSTIDKIRTSFEVDKYVKEQNKIGKN